MSRDPQRRLAEEIAGFATDPYGHALFAYPWGRDALAGFSGPRRWQIEELRELGDHLSNPDTRFTPYRKAIAKGHGVGGSALIALVCKWALDTCPDTRIVLTANTEGQLISKTMPEVDKWHRLSITRDWFRSSALSLASAQAAHSRSWRLDAVPWSATNSEAFAGLHNVGKRIVVAFDESSKVADQIFEVTEGALTDSGTELIWLALSNPTRNIGRFRDCFGKYRHLWRTRHLDSRTVEGTDAAYLDELVATYGENSDFTKVRVRGLFPSASSMQFIGSELVDAAANRLVASGSIMPSEAVVIGLDHARFGEDSTIMAVRQGRDARSRPWREWRGANSLEIAGGVAEEATRFKADAIFVDAGGPNAGGITDRLRQLLGATTAVFEIDFGGKGRDAIWRGELRTKTANKRAEIYTKTRNWLEYGSIPANQRLADDLTAIEYTYDANNAILLEAKKHLRARGLPSSDWSDALALTFAEDVQARGMRSIYDRLGISPVEEYDRYAELG